MSGKGRCDDKRIANAVAFKIRCKGASIPEAMRATKFTLKESEDTSKQMAVRRAYQKAVNAPSAVLVNRRSSSDVSPLTDTVVASSAAASASSRSQTSTASKPRSPPCTPPVVPKPKERLIRKTARAMQKHRFNKLAKSEHMKSALKRASTLYAREKKNRTVYQVMKLRAE